MNREELLRALNHAFSLKYNSLAEYIVSANPHIAPGMEQHLACVKEIAEEDKKQRDEVSGVIEAFSAIPRIQPHSDEVGHLNYLSIDFLASFLSEKLMEQASLFELYAVQSHEWPLAQDLFHRLAEHTRTQQQRLARSSCSSDHSAG